MAKESILQFQPSGENLDRNLRNPKGKEFLPDEDEELVNKNNQNKFATGEDLIDEDDSFYEMNKNNTEEIEESADEYHGPKANEYKELTEEEIAARYPEYDPNHSSSPDNSQQSNLETEIIYPIKNAKDKTIEYDPAKQNERGRSGQFRDNLKTIPDSKKVRGLRERIRAIFHNSYEQDQDNKIQPEVMAEE